MRKTGILTIAAAMLAAPTLAQDNNVAGNASAADAVTTTDTDTAAIGAPDNGLVAPPATAPATTDAPIGTAYGETARGERDGFPWGVLGLLGLAGLLGRRRSSDVNDDRTRA